MSMYLYVYTYTHGKGKNKELFSYICNVYNVHDKDAVGIH